MRKFKQLLLLVISITLVGCHTTGSIKQKAWKVQQGMTTEEIDKGIRSLKAISGRNNIFHTDKYVVIDDCYNANPMSMKASLSVLNEANTRKVAILGNMYELGENEKHCRHDLYS